MTKAKTPSFVITLEMGTKKMSNQQQIVKIITGESEINRQLYNACLGELLKREKQMKRRRLYKKLIRKSFGISKQISLYEAKLAKDKKNATFNKIKKQLQKEK